MSLSSTDSSSLGRVRTAGRARPFSLASTSPCNRMIAARKDANAS
ncbi:Uncharacterised protein [Mycobacterium tuberculosis]|nr:Uncharacterised protein [Mycobacterium tuberculosis]CPA92826.1 Uncharacterised protein [Mycobacterium tuberculosis]